MVSSGDESGGNGASRNGAGRAWADGPEAAREKAALDRARAANDRARAAREREDAIVLRAEAAAERAEAERQLAGIDRLTRVSLRGFGLNQIEREIQRAQRLDRPLVLALVGVDLKALNNGHGRHAGDVLLRRVADMLGMELRSYDVIARFSGDEFVCTLENIDAEMAWQRFRGIIEKLQANGSPPPITLGITELEDGDNLERLLARAGEALVDATRS